MNEKTKNLLLELLNKNKDYENMYEEEMAAVYDLFYKYNNREWIGKQKSIVENRTDDKSSILELACGTGLLLEEIEDDFSRSTGIDYSTGMLKIASNRCRQSQLYKDDFTNITEIKDHFQNVVMMGNPINHYPPRVLQDIISSVQKVTNKRGKFIFDFIPTEVWEVNKPANIRRVSVDDFEIMRCDSAEVESKIESNYHYKKLNSTYTITKKGKEKNINVSSNLFSHPTQKHKKIVSNFGEIIHIEKTEDNRKVFVVEME